MVRKRSKGAKRQFDSEDELETESDYEDDPVYKPETKKYSLRQRKRPTFNSDDYEYEEDLLEAPPRKDPSDDEDFEVKNKKEPNSKENKTADDENVEEPVNTTEASSEEAANVQDELVDFEDMIRADIVMNKNRIDYDNVIQKTEIKINPISESEKVAETEKRRQRQPITKPKGRRGRKPKRRTSDIELDEPQFLAPQIQENENDEDYHPYKPKRTRKPKTRPAGEIDSSILEDFDDYDFEDQNDVDYNPNDDLEYPGLSGLSNYILDKQISADIENDMEDTQNTTEEPVNSFKSVDNSNSSSVVDTSASETAPDTTAHETISQGTETPNTTKHVQQESKSSVPTADTTSAAAIPDTTETEISPAEDNNDVDDGVPRQLNEKSGAFEKVSSTSYASVIRLNETVVNNSDLHVNGSAKHIENPEVNIVDCKEEIESEDDDIVFIEDERKCEVIVLDD